MRRETVLVVCLLAVFAGMIGVAAVAPDALAEREGSDGPSPQPHLDTQEVTITPEEVGGETVTLSIELFLRQVTRSSGSTIENAEVRSENLSVTLRATDARTGLIEDTTELDVEPVEGERDFSITGEITVDRNSNYDLEALVYQNDRRIETGRTTLRGLDNLQPDYAQSPISFEAFSGANLPVVGYTVEDAGDGRADLGVSAYVTNTGGSGHDDVEVELIARQTDSNIVADRERVRVGDIRPGRTETAEAILTVPDDYNYHLDAIIWRDGVVVDSVREGATLDPETDAPEGNDTDEDGGGGVEVGEFDTDDTVDDEYDTSDDRPDSDTDEQPGFGFLAGLLALLIVAAAWIARRTTDRSDHQ